VIIPFNLAWWLLVAVLVAVAVAGSLWLRRCPPARQSRTLLAAAVANVLFCWTFTADYWLDPAGQLPWRANLPLQFCNLTAVLLVAMVATGQRPLVLVCFYPGAIAGLLALMSPAPMFTGHPVFDLKNLFFVQHGLNAVIPFVYSAVGRYRPRWRDAPLAMAWFAGFSLIMLVVTLALRHLFDPRSNYFYFFAPEGAGLLDLLYRAIPLPVLYEAPILVVAIPLLWLHVAAYRGISWLHRWAGAAPTA